MTKNHDRLKMEILSRNNAEREVFFEELKRSDNPALLQEVLELFLQEAVEVSQGLTTKRYSLYRLAIVLGHNQHVSLEQLNTMLYHEAVPPNLKRNIIQYAGTHNPEFLRHLAETNELPNGLMTEEVSDIIISSAAAPFDICETIFSRPNSSLYQQSMYIQHPDLPIDKLMDFRLPGESLITAEGALLLKEWVLFCMERQTEVIEWMSKNQPHLLDLPFEWACKLVAGMPGASAV